MAGLLSRAGSDFLVKVGQRRGVFFPIEMFASKRASASGKTLAQGFIVVKFQDGVRDPEGIDFLQDPRLFAVADKASDIRARYNNGPAHGEKLRKLCG